MPEAPWAGSEPATGIRRRQARRPRRRPRRSGARRRSPTAGAPRGRRARRWSGAPRWRPGPSTSFMPQTGARSRNGRFIRTARAKPRSLAVARVGPVRFTAPVRRAAITWRIARTSSSSEIHGQTCVPRPMGPLSPALVSRRSGFSTPSGCTIGAVRRTATAASGPAPNAAASHSPHRSARNDSPRGACSSRRTPGWRAVVADGRRRHEVRGIRSQFAHGAGEGAGRDDARPQQRVLVLVGPGEAADARAVQPDHGDGAREHRGVEWLVRRQPLDFVGGLGRPAHEGRHREAVGAEALDERSADEARRACDDDPPTAVSGQRALGRAAFRQASPRG